MRAILLNLEFQLYGTREVVIVPGGRHEKAELSRLQQQLGIKWYSTRVS